MDSSWIYFIIAILISITVHEFCHAWMATYLGDNTAKLAGRLSLNPLAHLDPIGTLLLFLVHFGWGKPVPFNPYHLKNPRLGSFLISLAGPLSNFALALIFSIPLKYVSATSPLIPFLESLVFINIGLMVFNLLPIHPLDGAKVFAYFVPRRFDRQMAEYFRLGPFILVGIILFERATGIGILSPIIIGAIQKIALLLGLTT